MFIVLRKHVKLKAAPLHTFRGNVQIKLLMETTGAFCENLSQLSGEEENGFPVETRSGR